MTESSLVQLISENNYAKVALGGIIILVVVSLLLKLIRLAIVCMIVFFVVTVAIAFWNSGKSAKEAFMASMDSLGWLREGAKDDVQLDVWNSHHFDANMRDGFWSALLERSFPRIYKYEALTHLRDHGRSDKEGILVFPAEINDLPEGAVHATAGEIIREIRSSSGNPWYGITRVTPKLVFEERTVSGGCSSAFLVHIDACVHARGKSRGGCLWAHARFVIDDGRVDILAVGSIGVENEDRVVDGPTGVVGGVAGAGLDETSNYVFL